MCDNMNNLSSYSSPSFSYCYLTEAVAPFHCNASSSAGTIMNTPPYDAKPARSSPFTEEDSKSHPEVIVNNASCSSSDKRRKFGTDESSSTSSYLKNSNGGKSKKLQKKGGEKMKKGEEIMKTKLEEPPNGYIHVRARRGQATDNHSLAERVRREKISERMKMLQSLVPGCDKVTGKAHMLDEIINYVQSLQNQVEFLSMRLASMNPMFFEYAGQLDEIQRIGAALLVSEQVSHGDQSNQSSNIGPRATALDYQMFFNPLLSSLLQPKLLGPTTSFSQDGGSDSAMVQVGEEVQEGFSDQLLGFNNILCPSLD